MIQRIQTLYMLASTILLGLLFILPFAEIEMNQAFFEFNAWGISGEQEAFKNGWSIALLLGISTVLHLITIFLFKKRILQVRLMVFAILISLGLLGLLFFFVHQSFDGATISYKIPIVFPLVIVILDYLAIRSIGKDIALLRSTDRIR